MQIGTKNSINISAFGFENKEKHPTYVLQTRYEEKHVDNSRKRQNTLWSFQRF